jgi:2-dehydro-3-deoxyphosphogluconate aldolase/(4S)-4-hydroxy-2-oxoglutarate aldolase
VDVFETIAADRAVAVVRAERVADPAGLAETLAAAGIRCVEFTFTIPAVLEVIGEAAASRAVVGAGTVVRAEEARDAIVAGARFVAAPAVVPDVVAPCRDADVPVFLGAFTPTEVAAAFAAGATAVKLFPASVGGAGYVKALRGPFPEIPLIPSGGIDLRNARDFLAAGAVAVYAGSGLAPPELVAAGDHAEIGRRAHDFVASLG